MLDLFEDLDPIVRISLTMFLLALFLAVILRFLRPK
jgi:hypothetical protein